MKRFPALFCFRCSALSSCESRAIPRSPPAFQAIDRPNTLTWNLVKPQIAQAQMIIVPEMIGSVIGVYNGKTFNSVEIKPEMIGTYLAEYSCSYKFVRHGRPGIGATHSSRFIPLK